MSIHPRQVAARTTAAAGVLNDLVARLPVAVHNAGRADHDHDRPRGEDAGVRSKGSHSDPTAAAALGRVSHDHLGDVVDQLDSLALTLALLTSFAERWDKVTVKAQRCSGGRTVEDWSRPNCGEWVETYRTADGKQHERAHGLCVGCRRRRDRWLQSHDDG